MAAAVCIDYTGTPFTEAAANGGKSRIYAGLSSDSSAGGDPWTRVDSVVGPTDVAWGGWAGRYKAPPELFVTGG